MKDRHIRLHLELPAESAIDNAISQVELCGASEELTDIVIMLSDARKKLSEYLDKELINYLTK